MHPDDWQVPLELMPYLQWFAAVCDDEPAPALVDASPDALEVFPAPASDRWARIHRIWAAHDRVKAEQGICPHCGSQGCPHCADTDALEIVPPSDDDALPVPPNPNPDETWSDIVPLNRAAELARLQFNVEYTRARARFEPEWFARYTEALNEQARYLAATE